MSNDELAPHTPEYMKSMNPKERSAYMKELGAKGHETQSQLAADASGESAEITLKLKAIKVEAGATELDDKVKWLSEAIKIYQNYGRIDKVARLNETLTKLVDTQTKVHLMLESQITTDTIWTGIVDIISATVPDAQVKEQLSSKIHDYLSALIQGALTAKGMK